MEINKESNCLTLELLWRSPELLRDPCAPPRGSQKGDVYSFAMILVDIHGRCGPWGQTAFTSRGEVPCATLGYTVLTSNGKILYEP